MSKTELTRHEIREKALQALFPLDFNADLTKQDAIDYDWLMIIGKSSVKMAKT